MVETDYEAHVIDIAIDVYFCAKISEWDNMNRVILNPACKSYEEQFPQSSEEQLDMRMLENDLYKLEESCLNHKLKATDEQITNMLKIATKK